MPSGVKHLCGVRKKDGKPCGMAAGYGTPHPGEGPCKYHMGCTPAMVKKYALVAGEKLAERYGDAVPIRAEHALEYCIQTTYGKVLYAQKRIDALHSEGQDLVYQSKEILRRPLSLGREGEDPSTEVEELRVDNEQKLSIWAKLHDKYVDDLAKYSRMAIQSGLEERQVRMVEREAERVVNVMHQTLLDLGVDVNNPRNLDVIQKNLRLLDAEVVEGEVVG